MHFSIQFHVIKWFHTTDWHLYYLLGDGGKGKGKGVHTSIFDSMDRDNCGKQIYCTSSCVGWKYDLHHNIKGICFEALSISSHTWTSTVSERTENFVPCCSKSATSSKVYFSPMNEFIVQSRPRSSCPTSQQNNTPEKSIRFQFNALYSALPRPSVLET